FVWHLYFRAQRSRVRIQSTCGAHHLAHKGATGKLAEGKLGGNALIDQAIVALRHIDEDAERAGLRDAEEHARATIIPVLGFHRDAADRFQQVRAVVDAYAVLGVRDFCVAGRESKVLQVDCVVHVTRRKAFCLERSGIKVDHDLAHLATVGSGKVDAIYHRDLLADAEDAVIIKLGLGEFVAREAHLYDRHAGGRVAEDEGGLHAGRHAPEDGLRDGGGLPQGLGYFRPRMEIEPDDAQSIQCLRLDPLYIINSR